MATGTTPFTRGVDGSNSFTYSLTLPYLFYFQPLVIGYALGRIHQLADQREHHSDPREPKGGGQ